MPKKDIKNGHSAESISRPPIVVIMGHVDHGKSTLLDYVRKTKTTEKEAGGITQHIGAYEAETEHNGQNKKITFLDTPGHEAFSKMRSRGAKVADIAVLVVAADDGVQPQTVEAYQSIKEAGLPFLVAANKVDKADAETERLKAQLAEKEIYVEGYGGNIPFVPVSAKTGQGIPELLDMILLLADMENLSADSFANASGIILESNMDQKRGISSTLLIKNGSMKKGMFVLSGESSSPVRILENFSGQSIDEASFSSPVRITGFNLMPRVGEKFETFKTKRDLDEAVSKEIVNKKIKKDSSFAPQNNNEKTKKALVKIILKADMSGSLEALEKEMIKLNDNEVDIFILRSGVGNINEDDAKFASTDKNSVIFGFNAEIDSSAKEIIERYSIPNFTSNIIYKITEWLTEEIKKRKSEIPREEITGTAKILKTFSRQKNKQVIGGKVISGKMIESRFFKIKRRDVEIGEGKIINLQAGKKEVKEVETENEFGAMTENKIEIIKDDEIVIIVK